MLMPHAPMCQRMASISSSLSASPAHSNHITLFFAVPHREVAIAHFVSFAVNPVAELVAALLYGALVYVGFAHVVEQRGYDYALGFDVS